MAGYGSSQPPKAPGASIVRVLPPLPSTERGAFCQIATDAQGERVLYCNGTNVIWRSVAGLQGEEKPEDIFCWKGHTKRTTAAAMSPNGNWVLSGDVTGAVRLWGSKGEHIQKAEYRLWDGAIKDVAWSSDSTRLFAAGDGKEIKAVALIWDTGSKTGEVSGHTKAVNSISFRSQRPFRIATGSEDMTVIMHQGPPFKFVRSHTVHTNFVNSVRYSPDGEWFVSAGSDSKLCLYEGKEGELVKEFAKPDKITGSLWAAAWSPDSKRVVTAGGDKKIRVWDRESGAQVGEAQVGKAALEDMQVGIAWSTPTTAVSTCLDGRLLIWTIGEDGSIALATEVDGTQGPLTCVACDAATGILTQGGSDGVVAITPPGRPPKRVKIGKGVTHILAHSAGYKGPPEVWVFSLDDCARRVSLESCEVIGEPIKVGEFVVGAAWMDPEETKCLVATGKNNVHCLAGGAIAWTKSDALPRRPTAVASIPGKSVAIAIEKPEGSSLGMQSNQFDILLFVSEDAGLAQKAVVQGPKGEVCSLKFSPTGEFLAAGDAANKVMIWNLGAEPAATVLEGANHTSRVTCLDWLPGGRRLVSGSLDRHAYIWNVDETSKKVHISEAHKGGVFGVAACSESSFASVGQDGFMLVHQLA